MVSGADALEFDIEGGCREGDEVGGGVVVFTGCLGAKKLRIDWLLLTIMDKRSLCFKLLPKMVERCRCCWTFRTRFNSKRKT